MTHAFLAKAAFVSHVAVISTILAVIRTLIGFKHWRMLLQALKWVSYPIAVAVKAPAQSLPVSSQSAS